MALLVLPVLALGAELEVKVPHDAGHDDAHLVLGEVAADAVAGADGEGLDGVAVVLVEGGRGVRLGVGEPALGDELGRAVEVVGVGVGGGLVDGNLGL